MVFIILQILVGINAVVSIILQVLMPIHALRMFLGELTPNGKRY